MDRAMLWHNFERWRRARASAFSDEEITEAAASGDSLVIKRCDAGGPQVSGPAPSSEHRHERLAPGGEFTSLINGTRPEFENSGRIYKRFVDDGLLDRLFGMLRAQVLLSFPVVDAIKIKAYPVSVCATIVLFVLCKPSERKLPLKQLDFALKVGFRGGLPIDLCEHGQQTASRAVRAGEDDELVTISLLHDITETISAKNHGGVCV